MVKIAIDVGYGDVKVAFADTVFKFTHAVAHVGYSSVDFAQNAQAVFNYNGQEYLVGDDALLNTPFSTRNYDYLEKYAPLLVYKALKMAGVPADGSIISISTGLSLKDWHNAEAFASKLNKIFVNDELYTCEVSLYPQGKGIYLDYKNTHDVVEDFFAIADIGFNTFDLLFFRDGKPVRGKSYANKNGVNVIVSQLQKYLTNKYKLNLSEQKVKVILQDKALKIAGEPVDVSVIVNNEIQKYAEALVNDIINSSEDIITNDINKIIVSGGGAYLLEEAKVKMFANQVYSDSPYEFANVRGYLLGE